MTGPIAKALDRIIEIMQQPQAIAEAGNSYTTQEAEAIQRGYDALQQIDPEPESHVARFRNEELLTFAGKAIEMGVILLNRDGFRALKGDLFVDRDQRVVEAGLTALDRATAHSRN